MSYTDDLILNYLKKSHECIVGEPDTLMKAMDRTGLVQKEVQYKTKSGKIATRKQWVKASEDQFNTPVSHKDSMRQGSPRTTMYEKGDVVKVLLKNGSTVKGKVREVKFDDNDKPIYIVHENYMEITQSPKLHEVRSSSLIPVTGAQSDAVKKRHGMINTSESDKSDKSEKTGKQNVKTDTGSKDSVQGKTGEYNGIKYKIHTNNPFDKLNNKYNHSVAEGQIKDYGFCIEDETNKEKNPLAQCVDNNTDVEGIVAEVTGKKTKKNTTSSKNQQSSHFTGKNMNELLSSLKNSGYEMDSSDQHSPQDTVILYKDKKEFTATFNKYSDDGVEVLNIKPVQQTTQSGQKIDFGNRDKQSLMKLLQSGKSREDIMSAAEEQGITWKKSDNAGINWMRCSMAITKTSTKGNKKD